jgi:hypothetical protein
MPMKAQKTMSCTTWAWSARGTAPSARKPPSRLEQHFQIRDFCLHAPSR